jgi:hypothetical protein
MEVLYSPNRLFERRAELQHERIKTTKAIEEAYQRVVEIDREIDRVDCVVALHMADDPDRVVRTRVFDRHTVRDYTIAMDGPVPDCRPCSDAVQLDRLPETAVDAAIAKHDRTTARADASIKAMALAAAVAQVYEEEFGGGADAVADSPCDDDDDDAGGRETVGSAVSVIDQEAS